MESILVGVLAAADVVVPVSSSSLSGLDYFIKIMELVWPLITTILVPVLSLLAWKLVAYILAKRKITLTKEQEELYKSWFNQAISKVNQLAFVALKTKGEKIPSDKKAFEAISFVEQKIEEYGWDKKSRDWLLEQLESHLNVAEGNLPEDVPVKPITAPPVVTGNTISTTPATPAITDSVVPPKV